MAPVLHAAHISKAYPLHHGARIHNFRDDITGWLKGFVGGKKKNKSMTAVLNDINFTLDRGDILGVVGRNGAGKTTLLKILAGIVKPTHGEVKYQGKLVSILELGAGFHPDLSGRDNIYFNGELLGLKRERIRQRFNDIVMFSELDTSIDEPVKNYSSGMYLRLAFSVFAHLDTNILLLDEVISVGDIAFRQKSYSKIIDLANRGTTIILVSHDPDQVKEICNKCLWLDKGEVMKFGATSEVLDSYLEKYLIAESVVLKDAVITNYTISWPAGLNICHELNIFRYGLKAKRKPASAPLTTHDELEFVIEFEKLNGAENLEITITILSLYGTWVLVDSYGIYERYDNSAKEKGHYRCVCTIPSGIINFGIYQLGFLVSRSAVLIYQNPCLLNFKIDLFHVDGVKGHLAREAASLIKPMGLWEIHRT